MSRLLAKAIDVLAPATRHLRHPLTDRERTSLTRAANRRRTPARSYSLR